MKIMKQLEKHNFDIVAVQKLGKIYLLFAPNAIYAWGDKKEVDKFNKNKKEIK